MMHTPVILASQSPRRKELLAMADIPFEVIVSNTDESFPEGLSFKEAAMHIAQQKALAVQASAGEGRTIIAADTVVICDDELIGKPKDEEDAIRMLRKLSGKTHEVITGVCILFGREETKGFAGKTGGRSPADFILEKEGRVDPPGRIVASEDPKEAAVTFSDSTMVTFNELSEAQIEYYVSKYKPLDKAGAYGIQEWIGAVAIKKIEGDFYNVMGLPVSRIWEMLSLREKGIRG